MTQLFFDPDTFMPYTYLTIVQIGIIRFNVGRCLTSLLCRPVLTGGDLASSS
ncbi:hypothetical protein ACFQZI_11415 [Mucilaginibacter lutimaris]|uniref:Uncharacterized protein n=1 Tax=Mucilaginibacter lutimaris TaxID=931629 RepID=A0ABW2ZH00_9SPHI